MAGRVWLGLDDTALLIACGDAGLVHRGIRPRHAAVACRSGGPRAGEAHGGLVLFRRSVRSTDYGLQARLLTGFWNSEGRRWDWFNRIVYLPTAP